MQAAEKKLDPIKLAVNVPLSQQRAFDLFTQRIGTWWPLDIHAVDGASVESCFVEPRVGGRIFERSKSGVESAWADVLVFDPPRRLIVSWHPKESPPTELEISFTPSDQGTLVELEHRNWEVFADMAVEARNEYSSGWMPVLDRYVSAARGQGNAR